MNDLVISFGEQGMMHVANYAIMLRIIAWDGVATAQTVESGANVECNEQTKACFFGKYLQSFVPIHKALRDAEEAETKKSKPLQDG